MNFLLRLQKDVSDGVLMENRCSPHKPFQALLWYAVAENIISKNKLRKSQSSKKDLYFDLNRKYVVLV